MNATMDQKGILLESGTNEFEIVEFSVGNVNYGINVAKVREVINLLPVTEMPNAHPWVDGVFTLRGRVIPLVNLSRVLGDRSGKPAKNIIVSELNNYFCGFLVNEVSRIHRISWSDMETPPNVSESQMVVGIIKMPDKVVMLLDFEKIVAAINPEINAKLTAIPPTSAGLTAERMTKHIVVAEDSHMLRELLVHTLHGAGYVKMLAYSNGKDAWESLSAMAQDTNRAITDRVDLIITDIEMPQMDGHHLLKRIRENQVLNALPVVIFSSLINEEMKLKGDALGANGQISKPEIGQLIELVDSLILKKQ